MTQTNNTPQRQQRPIDALKSILKAPSVEEQFQNTLKENTGLEKHDTDKQYTTETATAY